MTTTSDARTIYEIFRACRLCGAGGGYKMPIIQNVIPFDFSDVELREKIRECVQIEVRADDKMPPLICELCVDKVNDYYEFMEMCRLTNKRTRMRLGLPPQTMAQGEPDDCILGVTETVFGSDEGKAPPQRSRPCPKSKKNIIAINVKKEEVKVETPKIEKPKENQNSAISKRFAKELVNLKTTEKKSNCETPRARNRESRIYVDSRSSSVSGRSTPVPARETRRMTSIDMIESPRVTRRGQDLNTSNSSTRDTRKSASDDNLSLGKLNQQEQKKKQDEQKQATNKPVQKKGKESVKVEIPSVSSDELLSTRRTKRGHEKYSPEADVPLKKIKLTIKLPPAPKVPQLRPNQCPVCGNIASTASGLYSHMRRHPVLYTSPELACDPCSEWFSTPEEAETHHKKHTKYKCRHCKQHYKQLTGYYEHFEKKNCRPFEELPDVQCQACWAFFPTATLRKQHKCPGIGARPGGDCKVCSKHFVTAKSLKKHEETCASKNRETKPAKAELPKQAKIEVSKPATREISKSSKNDIAKSSKREVSKSAKSEVSKSAKSEVSKSAKSEVSKSAKSEIYKSAKSEVSKSAKSEVSKTTKSGASKTAKGGVRVDRRTASRLQPAEIRVAKCDPLLKKRKSRSGRYNVADVPHDYGLDKNCTYPYKYSGMRVKSEPLCFNGMVSINKEIQRELYREEDFVHWDSDLSSDSENEVEEFNEKRKKVPTLTALSLKTIFSKRCLGKVPRKLRKVKSDKLFDSLFNATVDNDLTCNINSIIDNLGKEDRSSVNLLSFGVDSDAVLDKSILGRGDDIDAVSNDVNKNNKDIDVNSDTHVNNKNKIESKKDNNDDCETDATTYNAKIQDKLTDTTSVVNSKDKLNNGSESDKTEADLSSQNSNSQDDAYNPGINPSVEEGCESNNGKTEINDETSNNHETRSNEGSNLNIEASEICEENGKSYRENEETNTQNGNFSNGISVKNFNLDAEIDDNKLMDELNAQIGESEMKYVESRQLEASSNFSIDNLIEKPMQQSFGLGSIGDEEFI